MTNTPHWVQTPATPEAIEIVKRFDAIVDKIGILTKGHGIDSDTRLERWRALGGVAGKLVLSSPGAVLYVHQEMPHRDAVALQWLAQHPHASSLDIPGDMPGLLERRRVADISEYTLA